MINILLQQEEMELLQYLKLKIKMQEDKKIKKGINKDMLMILLLQKKIKQILKLQEII